MDGILNFYKPRGKTSFQIVSLVRRLTQTKRVGHAGTLDPMAEGVLVVLLGRATKLSERLMASEKTYRGEITLGLRTETADITGRILEEKIVPLLSSDQITESLQSFVGKIVQKTPPYSAMKVGGKRLYELARQNIYIAPPRQVEIFSVELLMWNSPVIEFRVRCSKGTYIRALAEDIAEKLATVGTLSALIRESSGGFHAEDSVREEDLTENFDWQKKLLPMPDFF